MASTSITGIALDQVTIATARVEALANFYRDAFELGEFDAETGHKGVQIGPLYLGFNQVYTPDTGSRVTLWFSVDDIMDTFERLAILGARVHYPPTREAEGPLLAEVDDIDGNRIGLRQRE
jgi:predicted enzyme related to lactoylglutathione lyase